LEVLPVSEPRGLFLTYVADSLASSLLSGLPEDREYWIRRELFSDCIPSQEFCRDFAEIHRETSVA
jgi:hypothetical protein